MIITGLYIYGVVFGLLLTALLWLFDTSWFMSQWSASKLKRAKSFSVFVLVILIIWLCYQNFAATLTLLVAVTGIIVLIDQLWLRRGRTQTNQAQPLIIEYARSFFGVLLLVWVIRSFIIQPYRVPTGSLEPTVMPGDFLAVNQFAFGLRFPVWNKTLIPVGQPKRGQIVCFYFPPNPSTILVKRVIGIPGDHVVYKNKVLFINGVEMKQEDVGTALDQEPSRAGVSEEFPVERKIENLDGVKHQIYVMKDGGLTQDYDITVPPHMYFMMGDNRDNSDDSRSWGFAPERNLIGKAFVIWLSWDPLHHKIRWDRIGTML
jgi:signal peptidase I